MTWWMARIESGQMAHKRRPTQLEFEKEAWETQGWTVLVWTDSIRLVSHESWTFEGVSPLWLMWRE